jgi:holliday junction DNA helicase RuvB
MNGLRPQSLAQFVGQPAARKILGVLIAAARKRGEPVPHLLMSGPPGLGKTTLARIVASEMGGNLVEIVGSSVKHVGDMTHHLLQLKSHDVLFLDEIHALPRRLEEILYPAMEDGVVAADHSAFDGMMKQLGVHTESKTRTVHRLPPFTLVGATTMQGLVTAPLRSRFRQILELQPYSVDELQQIVTSTAAKLSFALPDALALEIAKRSRGTARIALSHLLWYRDVVQGDGGVATAELLSMAFEMRGVDGHGLTRTDRDYLRVLVESEDAQGVDTLAAALGESVETLTESIEPYLLRCGYITRTPRGRTATERARQLFQEAAR